MARMVRKQIVMDPEQERALEEHAAALGVSQSELMRRAIDSWLEQVAEQERRDAAWEAIEEGWREAERRGIGSGGGGRTWTREELHERGRSD